MIPIKLTLRNFMSYRDNVPPLSFEGTHIACLCGDNGHGKSALLDAMTWALWGKARAKSADDLIHQGRAEMEVELEFEAGGERWRVIRKRSKPRTGRSGQTVLELQVKAGDGFRPESGNTVEETQKKIIGILHMDYDTFTNSAFLLQGQADKFTKNQPAERKEVLANILGLSKYDGCRERARDHARQREGQSRKLQEDITAIDQEVALRGEYEAEMGGVQEAIVQLEEKIKGQEGLTSQLRQQRESLEHRKKQLEGIEELVEQKGRELGEWNKQLEGHRARIAGYEEVQARRTAIEEGYQKLLAARSVNEELNEKLGALHEIEKHKNEVEKVVEKSRVALLAEQGIIAKQIEAAEARLKRLPQLEGEMKGAEARLRELAKQEEGLEERRRRSQELLTQLHHFESATSALEGEIKDIEDKLALLARGEARCPLCETELGFEGRQRIEVRYQADRQARAERYQACQTEAEQRRWEHWTLENEAAQLEAGIGQSKTAEERRLTLLRKEISDAGQLSLEMDGQRSRLAEIESRLAEGDFAAAEQKRLRELEGKVAALGYDVEGHRGVRQQINELKGFDELQRRLGEADKLAVHERESLARAEEAAARLSFALEADRREREGLAAELTSLPALLAELRQAEQAGQVLLGQQNELQRRLWTAEERLRRCTELEATRGEKGRQLSWAAEEEGIYKELAEAFGKQGIQAMLIDQKALPEIEEEANGLLSRLTDNRMHLKIDSHRETKKGGIIETLDINITDDWGTRNYEMFSGGEAFRIDFALRVALSRLLARRAGAPLPTLVIDEGFGTQDTAGRERLVQAISSIRDDFQRILVITHIEELKDEFDTRINVSKTAEGSMISVS